MKAISTPGYSNDHMSYYLKEEDVLFTGSSVISRPSAPMNCNHVIGNLLKFKQSLKLQQSVFPKVLMPLHGGVEIGINSIEQLLDHIQMTLLQIKAIISTQRVSTNDIVNAITKDNKITDTLDIQILHGNIRAYLQYLEQIKVITRAYVLHAQDQNLDTSIKGPGGLTMEQIYNQVQQSRKNDYRSGDESPDTILHPLHSGLKIHGSVSWKLC